MIISKTPFRISLIGGGTDFPDYYKKFPGLVIGGTIDKYCYVSARFLPNVFDYKHRIVWSKNEVVNTNNDIFHPTVKAVFNYLNWGASSSDSELKQDSPQNKNKSSREKWLKKILFERQRG